MEHPQQPSHSGASTPEPALGDHEQQLARAAVGITFVAMEVAAPLPPLPAGKEARDVEACYSPSEQTPLLPRSSPVSSSSSSTACLSGPDRKIAFAARDDDDDDDDDHASSRSVRYLGNLSPKRVYTIIALIHSQIFLAAFDGTIMSSSHPVITSHFHASHSASWLSTSFMLANIAANPVIGSLAGPVGRKPLFVFTTVLFGLSTLWCALAPSMLSFILARAACGLGVAGVWMLGGIMTSDIVPIESRGVWQAIGGLWFGCGAASGAALGGWMADVLGWRWEFGIQVPFILVASLVAYFVLPNNLGRDEADESTSIREAMRQFDYAGCALATISLTSFVLVASIGGNILPWSHPFVVASAVAAVASAVSFVAVEKRVAKPVFPLHFLTAYPFPSLILTSITSMAVVNSLYFHVPLWFQGVLLSSPTSSGIILVSPTLGSMVVGIATGLSITRWRRVGPQLQAGLVLITVGSLVVASTFSRHSGWSRAAYLASVLPIGLGGGGYFPGSYLGFLVSASQRDQATITTILVSTRSIGLVVGISGTSLVLQNGLRHYLDAFVAGPDKSDVIRRVRESVEAVAHLPAPYREQAIAGYEAALQLTFKTIAAIAVVGMLVGWTLRLPRVGEKK